MKFLLIFICLIFPFSSLFQIIESSISAVVCFNNCVNGN